uniref:Reverse transcriptase domain-containing protein n=1 Tax=Romanomermis culicivorax TaxID=13658 RepID=A0A915HXA6_ROMCU
MLIQSFSKKPLNIGGVILEVNTISTRNEHQSSEAGDTLKQLNTAAARITNNVPTIQTTDQIIGALSDQFQAQQLDIQGKIQEQIQAMKAHFSALAEQMQQLISTTTTVAAAGNNPPTPRPPPATSQFHSQERRDIYITNDTFWETELALAYGHPLAPIKPKAPSPPISGKIKVADGAIIIAHSPVVITMESTFGEHMIKCVILDKHSNDQCIIGTDSLTSRIMYISRCPKNQNTGRKATAQSNCPSRPTEEIVSQCRS